MALILAIGLSWCPAAAKPFKIIARSNPGVTTHQLRSGGMTIGVTENGGGMINHLSLPGLGDIMGSATNLYGRGGQVAIRDRSHKGAYNPTQAGFNETLGTQCQIYFDTNRCLIVAQRPMALWHGDGKYDFTQWEDVGPDPYRYDNGNTDEDGLDETRLVGRQKAEVHSEFDYYGTYEDYLGKNGISIPTIRHYFEVRFIRPPGHALGQFAAGTPAWNSRGIVSDISRNLPKGIHTGTDKDLNGMIAVWSLRHDIKKWPYAFAYLRGENGKWRTEKVNATSKKLIDKGNEGSVFILADSANPDTGIGLGLYRPKSDININSIVGINEKNGVIVYKENRTQRAKILLTPQRTEALTKYGFLQNLSGMINRTRLGSDIYEAYRSEYYIVSGTPRQIMDTITKIDEIKEQEG